MEYNFSKGIDRKKQGSRKWNLMYEAKVGVGDNIIPFSVADMEYETAPEIKAGLSKYIDSSILGYTVANKSYLESVVMWLKSEHNWDIKEQWIVNTPGVMTAIVNAIETFTEENEGIIIFRPVYYPFSMAIEATGRKIVNVPLIKDEGYYTIDFEAFERACSNSSNKMLIFANPHNPVGRVWREDELNKLVDIAKKYDIFIISDEIWLDLIMPGYEHIPMKKVTGDYSRIITCTAASKTFNVAGLQLSAIIIEDVNVRERYVKKLELTHRNMLNCLGYKATELAYNNCKRWLEEAIEQIDENRKIMEEFFNTNFPNAVYSPMEGTYLFWVNLNFLGKSKEELEKIMVENDLFLDEGYIFGDEAAGFERFNIACPKDHLIKALERLKSALSN